MNIRYLDWCQGEVNFIGKVKECPGTSGHYWDNKLLTLCDAGELHCVVLSKHRASD